MGIFEQIGKVSDFVRLSLPLIPLPFNLQSFDDTVQEIQQKWGDLPPSTPKPIDLDDLYRRLRYATDKNDWSGISPRDWKRSPWVFWRDNPCLADDSCFLDRYSLFLTEASCGSIKTLIHVYLRDFPKHQKSLTSISKLINYSLQNNNNGLLDVWRQRNQQYFLFDLSQGPLKLKKMYWQGSQSIESLSTLLGLTGELSQGIFVKEAYRLAVGTLHNDLNHGNANNLTKTLEWSEKDNSLRYPEYRIFLAEALLLAWLKRQPDLAIQMQIQGFMLRYYKHPRLNPGNWQGISENACAVILRWLAGETIRLFFEVLDKNSTYYDETTQRHWKYRRAFWWAYFEKQYLQEAWFAFADQARVLANKFLKPEERNYAILEGSGVQTNHAVLFMRIGGLTVVEWSHNGKCRIWAEDKTKPKMYQNRYSGSGLKWGSERIKDHYQTDGITHHHSEEGGWQGDVAAFIYKHTQINVGYRDYMPKP